jgi:hypothetical protein
MQHRSTLIVVALLGVFGAACGSSSGAASTTSAPAATSTSAAADTTVPSSVTTAVAVSGTDSQTPDGQRFVAALLAQPSQDSGFTDAQRRCISEAVIDNVGLKAIQDAGVTPEAVTADTDPNSPIPNVTITGPMADGIVTAMYKCADMGAYFLQALTSSGTTPLAPAKAQCLAAALASSSDLRNLLKVQLTGGDTTAAETSLQDAILPMAVTCKVTTSELAGAFGS